MLIFEEMKSLLTLILSIVTSVTFAQLNLQMESEDAYFRSRDNPADAEYYRQKTIDAIGSIDLNALYPEYISDSTNVVLLLTSETCGACPLMKIVMDSLQVRHPEITLLEFTNNPVRDSSFYTEGRFIGSNQLLYDPL